MLKIHAILLMLLSFKDLFLCIFSAIDQFTQLVTGVIKAPNVFYMETVGAFDLDAGFKILISI